MTSPITGHGTGPNGEQPINFILAQGHQLIPLRALVVSNQPVTRGEQVRDRNPEMDTDSGSMLKIEKGAGLVIQPAANRSRRHINDLACGTVREAMPFEHGFGGAFCTNHIGLGGPGWICFSFHGAPPAGARARGHGDCQI